MYQYDEHDQRLLDQRVAQFRDQMRRHLAGELSADEFRPLRLQNGLYIQRHAPMFRISVPYGHLASRQLRKLAHLARSYDRGYAHFTTRTNVQFNWPKLEDVPEMLAELASVQMHANQTSGNCIRNITADPFAGVAADEVADPRPFAEILRQWATYNPEFAFLPRKFKIAFNSAAEDRVVLRVYDIGLDLVRNEAGELGFRVLVGGGLGRTPILGEEIKPFLPWQHLISYCEAILRVYNRWGRRDNLWKARIKILVKALGPEEFGRQVEEEWANGKDGPNTITAAELARVSAHFAPPAYETLPAQDAAFDELLAGNKAFATWVKRNVRAHRQPGYAAVVLSLKKTGTAPGDVTAEQMDLIADLADRFSFGEARMLHEQNVALADVRRTDLFELWQAARAAGLATPNIGLLTDIICCPGGDFCSLANARSIPIADAIQRRFDDLDYQHDIGEIDLNISGCMNSCGHHHVGHIGILGVDKNDEEWYQVSIGGTQGNGTTLGKVIGPSFALDEIVGVIEKLLETYVELRHEDERFIDTVQRVGTEPFKARVYADRQPQRKAAHV
ncbi:MULTISPECIES: nitrite/sulfite reductase [unclassified Thauera]|jgi:sulfite reductase (NADPH) hemoprotein beta-component|uniref:nitrite/sulfite reductase n=1 Tax=unclassified Thauera TaxID=2609274 RepID=UPI0005AE0000|nr:MULTISPECIES: nitrite/sulfite reductase [unclassified Thauera]TMW74279.1 nitrite/sulfite reductase [Thauera sp. UPWRP]HNG65440.1 nitrite/sulfite reductase [Thauera aminoaromatica]KIN90125.1 nitrite and sulphite reductase 4Fe-4S domain protein [Thauera sp. SWB20]MBP6133181.1 nitrite/sulfite reductase [Thauera sp.]HNV91755.1 nitrite/sulfite reductase [Thauera aminoaromatica]